MRKSLEEWCKENNSLYLLDEWDSSNSDCTPRTISYGSTKPVSWHCNLGHRWEASPNSRTSPTSKNGCPVCGNKRVLEGFNDLASVAPSIAAEWDYDKNDCKPNQIAYGSNRAVWWKCAQGHVWSAVVGSRVATKSKCPVCIGHKIQTGYNDLATLFPELLKEWDYEKNKGVDPNSIASSYKQRVWWICPNGHNYETSVVSRARMGTGCPYCAGEKPISGVNDLVTLYPNIAAEYDISKNTIPISTLMPQSNKKVWWLCPKNHSYEAQVCQRMRSGCPYCAGKKVLIGFNDLFTTNPELQSSWDYTTNTESPLRISKGSQYKAHWICQYGHKWQAVVYSRANGKGCPECAKGLQSSVPEKIITYYLKEYLPEEVEVLNNIKYDFLDGLELDIFIPGLKIGIEYDGANWHKNVELDKAKDDICIDRQITLIRVREPLCPEYDTTSIIIKTDKPNNQMVYLEAAVKKTLSLVLSAISIEDIKTDINIKRDYSKIIASIYYSSVKDSLGEKHPDSLQQWNYPKNGLLTPFMVKPSSNKKVWWVCPSCHYEWEAIIETRYGKHAHNGCPKCSRKICITGVNDLQTLKPNIAREFDSERNGITPDHVFANSNKVYWWKCANNHSFQNKPSVRNDNSKCPYCYNRIVLIGYNDLATTNPELLDEWDYDRNDILPTQVTRGTERKVWWKCNNGHNWEAYIYSRTNNHPSGCPYCYRAKRKAKSLPFSSKTK